MVDETVPQLSWFLLWEVWMTTTLLQPSNCLIPRSANTDWCPVCARAQRWRYTVSLPDGAHIMVDKRQTAVTHTLQQGDQHFGKGGSQRGWNPVGERHFRKMGVTLGRDLRAKNEPTTERARAENSRQRKQQAQKPGGRKGSMLQLLRRKARLSEGTTVCWVSEGGCKTRLAKTHRAFRLLRFYSEAAVGKLFL